MRIAVLIFMCVFVSYLCIIIATGEHLQTASKRKSFVYFSVMEYMSIFCSTGILAPASISFRIFQLTTFSTVHFVCTVQIGVNKSSSSHQWTIHQLRH